MAASVLPTSWLYSSFYDFLQITESTLISTPYILSISTSSFREQREMIYLNLGLETYFYLIYQTCEKNSLFPMVCSYLAMIQGTKLQTLGPRKYFRMIRFNISLYRQDTASERGCMNTLRPPCQLVAELALRARSPSSWPGFFSFNTAFQIFILLWGQRPSVNLILVALFTKQRFYFCLWN